MTVVTSAEMIKFLVSCLHLWPSTVLAIDYETRVRTDAAERVDEQGGKRKVYPKPV